MPSAREKAESVTRDLTREAMASISELSFSEDGTTVPLTGAELASAGIYLLEAPSDGVAYPTDPRGVAVYNYDGATFPLEIYVPGTGSVNAALSDVTALVFGCGRLNDLKGTLEIEDVPCPRWLVAWGGSDAQEISLEGLLE